MKKSIFFVTLLLCVFQSLSTATPPRKNQKMYINVLKADLKEKPAIFAKNNTAVTYGDAVIVIREKGNWIEVSTDAHKKSSGWIPLASLTSKKIIVNEKGDNTVSASLDELALAGKGFNQEIETAYGQNKNLDYSFIDKMETYTVTFEELSDFINEGNLAGGIE